MGPDEFLAWYYKGGGREMHHELYQKVMKFNVVTWLYGPMPMQPFGWFKAKPITSIGQLKGLKYRTVGLAADLFRDMGAAVTTLPGAEIVPAIERGVIDAAEFNNPTSDRILGFPEVAKVWMVRSFHQASETLEVVVNKARYDALPPHLRSLLDYAIMAENADFQWTMADRNSRDLRWMVKEKNVRLVATPGDILTAQLEAFDRLVDRESQRDATGMFRKIAQSQRDFASRVVPLRHIITGGVNQIAFEVIGNDVTVSFAAEAGQLQLNAFEPIIAHSLFESITHLRNGCDTLRARCVTGITANREHLRRTVEHSIGIVTALNPYIGYANATQVAQEAHATGKSVYALVLEKGLLSKEKLDEVLRPEALTRPRFVPEKKDEG